MYATVTLIFALCVIIGSAYLLYLANLPIYLPMLGIFIGVLFAITAYMFHSRGFKYGISFGQISLGIALIGLGIINYTSD